MLIFDKFKSMEDFKVILYVLLAVGYFLYTVWRKAFKAADDTTPPDQVPHKDPQRPAAPPRPMPQQPMQPRTSMEDILRELQPKAERAREQAREVVEKAKVPFQPLPVPEKMTYNTMEYVPLKPRVLSWEKPAEARELAKNSWEIRNRRNESVKIKVKPAPNRYAELLRNPNGARDAVILAEIFKRKFE